MDIYLRDPEGLELHLPVNPSEITAKGVKKQVYGSVIR
ncbi:MAG: hypothetical protein A4E52_00441 [Pelotomaculum sp. PtaB.Bin013]|nr:MAG: hypothetical protein A4E52_00441 [Pelotomaculum sp. PtaB.Bin013]